MAKVISLFKISGTISDLTFRQTKDGPVAQMKPGPTRERVLNHERFRITRLIAAEFTMAGKEAKLLRDALGVAKDGMHVASLNGRMNGLFYKVAMSDTEHRRGCRYASNGNLQLLTGFDLNKDLLLANALPPGVRHDLDVVSGVMKVELPAFIARKKKGFPKEATHFRIVSGGAAIDFAKRSYRNDVRISELLPLRNKTPEAICLEHKLEAGVGEVLVQVLGIQLYKLEDGKEALLQGGAMRIMEAVKVEKGNEAIRQPGIEELEVKGMEMLRREGDEGGRLEEVGLGDEVRGTEEPGVGALEVALLAVEECPAVGIAGGGRDVRRRRRRGRGGVGGIRQGGNKATRHRGRRAEGKKGTVVVGVVLYALGGERLLFCRSSVDLHYICNPSDGTNWLRVVREDTGAPGNDP